MDTQTQIDRLIELAIVQRSELKQLVSELPQLREYLGAEIERTFEETEPQIRTELEEFCRARASDEHAKTGAALAAKVEQLSKQLEVTTAAKYSVLMAERAENANLLAKAEARIEDAASMLTHAVKEIVTDELSRFPRAGEIDQLRKEFAEPRGLNPRGRWMPDETYQRLDLVTINGDSFVSNIDGNRERPSRTAGDWTLSAARGNGGGGGGVTSMTDLVPVPTNGQLLIGNGSGFVNSTLTAGTGISISNGAGSITISATDGNITLDDGTAAAPSLNFTDDPNTGLYRPAADTVGIVGGGHDILRLTDIASATDYVQIKNGIGVGSPLHIIAEGASANIGMHLQPKGSGLLTISDGTDFNKGIRFRSSSSAASAVTLLDAVSTAGRVITLPDATDTLVGKATTDTLTNKTLTSPTLTTPISATLTSPTATPLTLGTGTSGAAITVLSADNNVGIGTTTPVQKLDVAGVTGGPSASGTSADGAIRLLAASFNMVLDMGVNHAVSSWIQSRDRTNYATNYDLALQPNGGNVGIGTTSLTGLTGSGGLKINSSTAGSSGAGALVIAGGLATGAASYFGGDATIYGLTVGRGAGAVSTNTAVGASAISGSNTGGNNTAIGYDALKVNTSGVQNVAIGRAALAANTTGAGNNSLGVGALSANQGGSNNIAIGGDALVTNTASSNNTAVGNQAGYFTTGASNTFLGSSAGYAVTTGAKNTIIGAYNGNQGGLDIRTASNYIVLSDGDGNPRAYFNGSIAIFNGTISPVQATTAAAPAYVKGAIYFDTTLNKLRVGGATAYETITSV
jgi:hypothetical protein